jgi:hypothetical protein
LCADRVEEGAYVGVRDHGWRGGSRCLRLFTTIKNKNKFWLAVFFLRLKSFFSSAC